MGRRRDHTFRKPTILRVHRLTPVIINHQSPPSGGWGGANSPFGSRFSVARKMIVGKRPPLLRCSTQGTSRLPEYPSDRTNVQHHQPHCTGDVPISRDTFYFEHLETKCNCFVPNSSHAPSAVVMTSPSIAAPAVHTGAPK